jgi:hypothetical protein
LCHAKFRREFLQTQQGMARHKESGHEPRARHPSIAVSSIERRPVRPNLQQPFRAEHVS